jgi:hypothetical protein
MEREIQTGGSAITGDGFRRIEVTTDYDLRLRHSAGYRPRGDD